MVTINVFMTFEYELFVVAVINRQSVQKPVCMLQLPYLRHVLVCLSGVPQLWQVASVQRMWRTVLLSPLTAAVPPLTDEQALECYHSLCLLHR